MKLTEKDVTTKPGKEQTNREKGFTKKNDETNKKKWWKPNTNSITNFHKISHYPISQYDFSKQLRIE